MTVPLFENYLYTFLSRTGGNKIAWCESVIPLSDSGIGHLSLPTPEHDQENEEVHASGCLLTFLLFFQDSGVRE